jgi:pimeloyl-ACP methyl ester carboxylesterase
MRRGRLRYLLGAAFRGLSWTEWGPPDGPAVVCVHGLTRTGRDFDALAAALAARGRRVYCPDLPGRGLSDRLPEPMLYQPPSYVLALAHLLARIGEEVDWVGTSLGGICGMMVAAAPGQPIRRLVLNDVGSRVPADALSRIAAYVRLPLTFADVTALEAHLRLVHASFGPLTAAEWRHLAETSARVLPDGRIVLHYDPAIGEAFATAVEGALDLGPVWARVAVPVLLLRGAESDVLEAEVARGMARRPGVELVEWPGIGHAPALMEPAQIGRIVEFLERR